MLISWGSSLLDVAVSVQETVNCLVVFHGVISAFGWSLCSTLWPAWGLCSDLGCHNLPRERALTRETAFRALGTAPATGKPQQGGDSPWLQVSNSEQWFRLSAVISVMSALGSDVSSRQWFQWCQLCLGGFLRPSQRQRDRSVVWWFHRVAFILSSTLQRGPGMTAPCCTGQKLGYLWGKRVWHQRGKTSGLKRIYVSIQSMMRSCHDQGEQPHLRGVSPGKGWDELITFYSRDMPPGENLGRLICLHSTQHSWVFILSKYIFLAVALNKQFLVLLILCSCEPALPNSADAAVLLMLMSVKAELRSPSDEPWR